MTKFSKFTALKYSNYQITPKFLEVGKNFRLLMHSWRFFPPDLFMKFSNFSKTVHTIVIKFCTVILRPKGPLHAQRHRNRMTGMRET